MRAPLLYLACLAASACGSDDGGGAPLDAARPSDSGLSDDAKVDLGAPDAAPDGAPDAAEVALDEGLDAVIDGALDAAGVILDEGTDGGVDAALDAHADRGALDAALEDGGYPSGPYGTRVGQVIADLSFPTGAGLARLSELREGSRLLLLLTVTGWCRTCVSNMETLQAWHASLGPRGLRPVAVLFQDADFQPPEPAYAEAWAARFEATFPVVTDPEFQLAAYINPAQESMAIIIDSQTMQIRSSKGFTPEATEAEVLRQLEAQD